MNQSRCVLAIVLGLGVVGAKADEPMTARDYYERGLVREQDDNLDGALADYSRAIERDPEFIDAWSGRSSLYSQRQEHEKAINDLTAILELRPGDLPALHNRAMYKEQVRDYDGAIADYTAIIEGPVDYSRFGSSPEQALSLARHYRGKIYQWRTAEPAKAVADYTEALRLVNEAEDMSPEGRKYEVEMLHWRRGDSHRAIGLYEEADRDYAASFELQPTYGNLLNSWAWLKATCPDPEVRDGERAVELAEQLGTRRPELLETRAAADAEVGRFDEAVEYQEKALRLLEGYDEARQTAARERLERYQAGQPFRMTVPE